MTAQVEPQTVPSPDQANRTLKSVQLMRGLAAVAVVFYHTQLILSQSEYGAISVFRSWASKGWLGVNFFFVLSGFIIMFAHARDLGRNKAIPSYLWKRFVRVYPVYWVALTGYLTLACVHMGHSNFSWDLINIASSYLLAPLTGNLTLPLQVAWTLFYEIHFYGMFVILIYNLKLGLAAFGLWIVAVLVANFAFSNGVVGSGMLHVWNLYFAFGAVTYWLYNKVSRQWGLPILSVGLATAVCGAIFLAGERVNDAQWQPAKLILLAVPFTMILLGSTLLEKQHNFRIPDLLMTIGAASYSIYLIHSPVISMLAFANHSLTASHVPAPALFLIISSMSIIAGVTFHVYVERRLLLWLRRTPSRAFPITANAGPLGAE